MKRRTRQAQFKAGRHALALDPGGSGILAELRRGVQPSPEAFGSFDVPPPLHYDAEEVEDGVAVLAVTGPLEHHDSSTEEEPAIWQSYEALICEIECALADECVGALILKIDSPGGVAAGMGEAHKAIRRLSKQYDKPVYAYADEMACSAAYHLASACAEVWLSESAVVGSVGVILCTVDETKALDKAGVAIRYVVTGKRKADLHPGQPVTSDVLDVAQEKVDYLGSLFFKAVGRARGMSPESVEALDAAVFHGPEAVSAGLADGVAGWDQFFGYVKGTIGATTVQDRATPLTGARTAPGKAKAMAKILKLTKAHEDAKAVVAGAEKAYEKAPTSVDAKARYLGALLLAIGAAHALAKANPSVAAKMKKVTEKYSEKKERLEETDDEEEEEEEEAMSDSESPSTAKSSEASSAPPKSSEEEEEEESEEEARGNARGESEEEEEKAIARGWAAAEAAYAKETKGIDAYGVRGPKGLRKAALKATAQRTVDAALGALSALPRRREADAKIEKDVAEIKATQRKEKVAAIVEQAKADGRAPTKELRASLRALGQEKGAEWLKGHVATLPKLHTTKAGGFVPRAGTDGDLLMGSAEQEAMIAQMTAGMKPDEAKAFRADFTARLKTSNGATPKH